MAVRIEGYTEKYRVGVIECLRRNYAWMGDESFSYINEWLRPAVTYHWQEDELLQLIPHKYGSVLLADDKVVGFLGTIYSLRYAGDRRYVFLRPTTWAIDKRYRIYLFKALKPQFAAADVIGDFAPLTSVAKALQNIYGFTCCDEIMYKFLVIPYCFFSKVKMQFIQDVTAIQDEVVQTEYLDHQMYGVKCVEVRVRKSGEYGYIFYHIVGGKNRRRIQILKVSRPEILSEFTHEIVWNMQKFERAFFKMKCDKRFFGGQAVHYPFYKKIEVVRLILDKKHLCNEAQYDFLYSDTCMLS